MSSQTVRRRLSRRSLSLAAPELRIGVAVLCALSGAALGANWIAPYNPWHPVGDPYAGPSWAHLLGTNDLGQDILSELIFGIRVSLLVGLAAAGVATALGTLIGLVSGYLRGPADELLMGITDTVMLIPGLPLLIVLITYTGPSFWGIAAVIGLVWWTETARAVRSRALQVSRMPFVEAARAVGMGRRRILWRHILPNTMPTVLARFVVAVPEAILTEAGLSFLGLGDPTAKSLGLMLNHAFARGGLINGLWWWYTFPVLAIAAIVLSVTLVGMGSEREA